jgi:hypothetical protein
MIDLIVSIMHSIVRPERADFFAKVLHRSSLAIARDDFARPLALRSPFFV